MGVEEDVAGGGRHEREQEALDEADGRRPRPDAQDGARGGGGPAEGQDQELPDRKSSRSELWQRRWSSNMSRMAVNSALRSCGVSKVVR